MDSGIALSGAFATLASLFLPGSWRCLRRLDHQLYHVSIHFQKLLGFIILPALGSVRSASLGSLKGRSGPHPSPYYLDSTFIIAAATLAGHRCLTAPSGLGLLFKHLTCSKCEGKTQSCSEQTTGLSKHSDSTYPRWCRMSGLGPCQTCCLSFSWKGCTFQTCAYLVRLKHIFSPCQEALGS